MLSYCFFSLMISLARSSHQNKLSEDCSQYFQSSRQFFGNPAEYLLPDSA
jgi:hypothetical protein